MPDRDQATRMLGFRDAAGALVCPADVVPASKPFICHVGAEDGSFKPTVEDLKAIRALLPQVGLTEGVVTESRGTGGIPFYNKRGVVICRIVEGRPAPVVIVPPPPAPPAPPAPAPEPKAIAPEAPAVRETSRVETSTRVEVQRERKSGTKARTKKS